MSRTLFLSKNTASKTKTAPNLLEMATKKSSKQDWSVSNVDLNHVLSASKTAPRQVTVHEQYLPRSDYTPYEVNVHRISFMGGFLEVESDNEEEASAAAPATNRPTSVLTTDTNVPQDTVDLNFASLQQEEDFVDLLTPEAISTKAGLKDDSPFVDLLTPENFLKHQADRHPEDDRVEKAQGYPKQRVEESPRKGNPKDPSGFMGREFSMVPKPEPMKNRIQQGPDGKFVYTRSSSNSPNDPQDDVHQGLTEVPEDAKIAAMPDPMVPNYGPDLFIPENLDDVDDLDNVKIDSLEVQDSVHESLPDMQLHDSNDQSSSGSIYFEKEPDFEEEPEGLWSFTAAKLPEKTSDSKDIPAAKLPPKTSDSVETPVAKLPGKPSLTVDIPPEHDFAIAKDKKKRGGSKKPAWQRNKPEEQPQEAYVSRTERRTEGTPDRYT